MLEIKKREFKPIPEGMYIVKIENVAWEANKWKNKEDDPEKNINYTFIVVSDESGDKAYEGRKIWQTNHPNSQRNLAIYNAAMGEKLEATDEESVNIDETKMIGREVRAVVKQAEYNGKISNKIDAVVALPISAPVGGQDNSEAKKEPKTDTTGTNEEINIEDIPF